MVGQFRAGGSDPRVGGARVATPGHDDFETRIKARVPRLKRTDGSIQAAEVPWAERYARWTLSFEAHAVRVIEACTTSEAARKLLGLDWSSLDQIMQRAVARGLRRRDWAQMDYIGVDEKSFLRGQSYVTIGSDLKRGVVLEVAEGSDTVAARQVITSLPEEIRGKIKAAAADMGVAIATAVHSELPQTPAAEKDHGHREKIRRQAPPSIQNFAQQDGKSDVIDVLKTH